MITKKNYTKHRLNSHLDFRPYYRQLFKIKSGNITFWQYAERAYLQVTQMAHGASFVVDNLVTEDNRDVFIKLLCNFIIEKPGAYLFNNTYTEFSKLELQGTFYPTFGKALLSQNKNTAV